MESIDFNKNLFLFFLTQRQTIGSFEELKLFPEFFLRIYVLHILTKVCVLRNLNILCSLLYILGLNLSILDTF